MRILNKYITRIIAVVAVAGLSWAMSSCDKDYDAPFDQPFVYIEATGGVSRVVVNSDVNNVNTYNVYLSSRAITSNVVVNYEVVVGDGLQAGRDFEIVNPGNSLTFMPGIYDLAIRVKWLPHRVDASKNNTLTIRLTDCSDKNVTIGVPGPDGLMRELVIEKRNP